MKDVFPNRFRTNLTIYMYFKSTQLSGAFRSLNELEMFIDSIARTSLTYKNLMNFVTKEKKETPVR